MCKIIVLLKNIWPNHAAYSQRCVPVVQFTWVQLAAILQLSQYCTFDGDSISTVITEPGQPVNLDVNYRLPSVEHWDWTGANMNHFLSHIHYICRIHSWHINKCTLVKTFFSIKSANTSHLLPNFLKNVFFVSHSKSSNLNYRCTDWSVANWWLADQGLISCDQWFAKCADQTFRSHKREQSRISFFVADQYQSNIWYKCKVYCIYIFNKQYKLTFRKAQKVFPL